MNFPSETKFNKKFQMYKNSFPTKQGKSVIMQKNKISTLI